MRALVLIALSLPVTVAAQRVGLPVDSIALTDTQRVDIDASDPHGWVRVSYAGQRNVRMDVRVTANDRAARDALGDVVRTTAGELPPLSIGDAAFGDAAYVAFARENIVVVVRSDDALSDARAVDMAIQTAPRGAPDLSPITVAVPQLVEGVPTSIQLPSDVVSAHVVAHGPAIARKTPRGWVVTRTGAGTVQLETRTADTLLRRR